MAAVTQTIPNFLGGVSNQPDDKKQPGQVTEALNAYPDPTFGLTKRPGFKFISELKKADGTVYHTAQLDNGKWFYYNRNDSEKYVGCITGVSSGSYGEVLIWNAATYAACTVNYGSNAREYLGKAESGDARASTLATDYDFLTIRDTSIITNKNRVVTTQANASFTAKTKGTIRIHLVEYAAKYQVKLKFVGGATTTCSYDTRAGDTATNDTDTVNNQGGAFLSANEILTELKDDLHAITNITATVVGNCIEVVGTAAFELFDIEGGKSGNALTAYQDTVDGISELAAEANHGRVVKILNTSGAADTYYAKFVATNGTSGPGVWEETVAPDVSPGLVNANMPHKLYNTNVNVFTFEAISYIARIVGDDTTNSHPSFNCKTIQKAFYYNNRLGFLTEDNVSMSRAGDFFNFYMTTAQTSTDADPVDISCSSIKPATLHGIVPVASGLLLFSQNQQFLMFSADGNLTPSTALIRGLSNYRMDTKISPVDAGTSINFISKTHDTAGFTRVFGFQPQGIGQPPRVVDVARAVSEYIPATITNISASPQNSFIAMYGGSDKIYFYRTYSDGERDIVQAWFKWQCPGDVHYVTVDSDTMFSIIKTGSSTGARYNLCSATMTQTPEEEIIVTSTGQQVNPHMDFYTAATNGLAGGSEKKVVYDSSGDFSKCYIPFEDVTSLTPVIIISGNATTNISGTTQSGFTITPTRASDGDGTYFKVPRKDLSGQAANVFVGYKYNYDITLPKLYYQKSPDGRMADYTANLTVSRMKFSIGQSSVVGFKLKRKGVRASTESFTGDGSTVAFSPGFDVKDKTDIVVKRNGAIQTLVTAFTGSTDDKKSQYTVADHSTLEDKVTITFGTAPIAAGTVNNASVAADDVEIFVDQWYTLQPTQDANYYLADDVPLDTQSLFILPIHQRTDNYTLRVFSNSPFPVALTSASWEGVYSPRYYRRT